MMEKLEATPSQTVGPFFAYSLTAEQYGYPYNSIVDDVLIDVQTVDEKIYITGKVFDGAGAVITDALIELWQADNSGRYRKIPVNGKNDDFTGFGRAGTGTNPDGSFLFTTIKPGSLNGAAPYINVMLLMRGTLRLLYTRIYFSDEINDTDLVFNSVDAGRRNTLIAKLSEENEKIAYHFDIHMQGDKETVFFDV
jgi:protocatechuate 3,4-dioxygenase, alpha subunit